MKYIVDPFSEKSHLIRHTVYCVIMQKNGLIKKRWYSMLVINE